MFQQSMTVKVGLKKKQQSITPPGLVQYPRKVGK